MELHAKVVGWTKLSIGDTSADSIASEYSTIRALTSVVRQNLGLTTEAGVLKENVNKNRYKDILPYDQTRVKLSLLANDSDSDYINASFIQGATETKQYIATQGPLSCTLVDFWRMIWQYGVKVVIMACREVEMTKRKCERYWATHLETSHFGPFIVSNMSESCPNEEVVVRSLTVQYQNETRTVSQFQYMAWPDHDIPYTPQGILETMDMARNAQANSTCPILIHCSAGCGRTGVICALDYVYDLLMTKQIREDFSVMEIVLEMRRQRPSAVQTQEQYQFVFSAVAQMFEREVQESVNHSSSLSQNPGSVCENVRELRNSPPNRGESIPTNPVCEQKPPDRSTSLPLQTLAGSASSQTMNDTYSVVNKKRQSKPSTLHHYDNEKEGEASGAQASPLYSTVRPKSKALNSAHSATPIYDTAVPPNSTLSHDASQDHLDGYEQVTASPTPSSSEDDYEYVSNPIRELASSYCAPGSLGFNCRIKKPRGPRDPPAEWAHLER